MPPHSHLPPGTSTDRIDTYTVASTAASVQVGVAIGNTDSKPFTFQAAAVADLLTKDIRGDDGNHIRLMGLKGRLAIDSSDAARPHVGVNNDFFTFAKPADGVRRALAVLAVAFWAVWGFPTSAPVTQLRYIGACHAAAVLHAQVHSRVLTGQGGAVVSCSGDCGALVHRRLSHSLQTVCR